jgi:hypothetical protein
MPVTDAPYRVMPISHLRDCLGFACQQVALTDEPIVVQRYRRQDVAIVPLWQWGLLKAVEAAIQAGEWPEVVPEVPAQTPTVGPCGDVLRNRTQEPSGAPPKEADREGHGLAGEG